MSLSLPLVFCCFLLQGLPGKREEKLIPSPTKTCFPRIAQFLPSISLKMIEHLVGWIEQCQRCYAAGVCTYVPRWRTKRRQKFRREASRATHSLIDEKAKSKFFFTPESAHKLGPYTSNLEGISMNTTWWLFSPPHEDISSWHHRMRWQWWPRGSSPEHRQSFSSPPDLGMPLWSRRQRCVGIFLSTSPPSTGGMNAIPLLRRGNGWAGGCVQYYRDDGSGRRVFMFMCRSTCILSSRKRYCLWLPCFVLAGKVLPVTVKLSQTRIATSCLLYWKKIKPNFFWGGGNA